MPLVSWQHFRQKELFRLDEREGQQDGVMKANIKQYFKKEEVFWSFGE